MLGRDVVSPVGNPPSSPTPTCPVEYVEWLKTVLADTYNFVSKNLSPAANAKDIL